MAPQDDRLLVVVARAGDRGAFAVLVTRHHPSLLRICQRASGDRELGADAAQEAVLHAMLGLDRLRHDDRFGPWLLGIGLNVCRRIARERYSRPSVAQSFSAGREPIADAPGPPEAAETAELARCVQLAIAELPPGQRDAVELFYLAGLTQGEIAAHLGTAIGAVKTRLHKARASLRPQLIDPRKEQFDMTHETLSDVPMRITDIRRTGDAQSPAARHIVILEDADGEHRLPIWIGETEANALAVALEQIELPRPGAYQFAAALLDAAGSGLRKVHISELVDGIFYAQVILTNGATIDARPSDALTLALVANVPVSVDREVLDTARRTEAALPEFVEEANNAPDDVRTLADEARGRLADSAEEVAEIAARVRDVR